MPSLLDRPGDGRGFTGGNRPGGDIAAGGGTDAGTRIERTVVGCGCDGKLHEHERSVARWQRAEMNGLISWWVVALVVGMSCPLWLRAMVERWDKRAVGRTRQLLEEVRSGARTHDAPMS
jgi:hypothetical protein